jgi:hypothetical protein
MSLARAGSPTPVDTLVAHVPLRGQFPSFDADVSTPAAAAAPGEWPVRATQLHRLHERTCEPGAARDPRVDPAVPSAALWAVHEDYAVTLRATYMRCVGHRVRDCRLITSRATRSNAKFYHLQLLEAGQSYAVWFQ